MLGAQMLVVELSAFDVGALDQQTLPLSQRACDLAGTRPAARRERLFEIVAEDVEGNARVLQDGDRGVLTFPQNAEDHVRVGDLVVSHGRG
jgi:hypothetical protein